MDYGIAAPKVPDYIALVTNISSELPNRVFTVAYEFIRKVRTEEARPASYENLRLESFSSTNRAYHRAHSRAVNPTPSSATPTRIYYSSRHLLLSLTLSVYKGQAGHSEK